MAMLNNQRLYKFTIQTYEWLNVNPGLLTNVNHAWFYFKKEFPAK